MDRLTKNYFLMICLVLLFVSGCKPFNIKSDPLNNNSEKTPRLDETSEPIKFLDKPLNILLLGIDARGEEKARADTIMVVQYSAEERSIKMVSIMRDSYVMIPGNKQQFNKINMAYFFGGEELLKQTIQENFDISIDHTVTVDFQGFINIIDTIIPDGIKLEVSEDIINNMKLDMQPGENYLHGEELLKYVRFRHDKLSDFGRVNRQQDVLLQIADEMNEKLNTFVGITKVPVLIDEVIKHIKTDLSISQLITLSTDMFSKPIETIETMKIPVSNSFENKTYPHAGAVLELDYAKNKEVIHNFFVKPTPVLNKEIEEP